MLDRLFSSKARVAILRLFLFNPENRFYQRQVSKLTDQPIRAVQREITRLEKIGLIESAEEGNRIYYKTNKRCPILEELKKILFKTSGIAESLKKSLLAPHNVKFAFIYGSYAKGEEGKLSDIDLLVIGNISSREISKILSRQKTVLRREINYAVFTLEEFREKIKQKDHFLNSILKDKKIFITGNEDEFKKIIRAR